MAGTDLTLSHHNNPEPIKTFLSYYFLTIGMIWVKFENFSNLPSLASKVGGKLFF